MRKQFAMFFVSASLFGLASLQNVSAVTFLVAPTGPSSGAALVLVIENVTNWLFFGFLLLASIIIVFAGFQFATGGGDPTQISAAKKKLIFAAIAIIIATLSKGFVTVVRSILGT